MALKSRKKPAPAGNRKNPVPGRGPAPGFSTFFRLPCLQPPEAGSRTKVNPSSPLAGTDYAAELEAKNKALARFWEHHRLPGQPEKVIASPRPRKYRTTSKRRCVRRGGVLHLPMGEELPRTRTPFTPSPLEPDEHATIYRFLRKKLSTPPFFPVAEQMNYLIIRGNYREQTVIFNVRTMTGVVVRKLKILGEHLRKEIETAASAFVYLAPEESEYYLESRQPRQGMTFKRLFGPANLRVFHDGRRLDFHPTSFSQVNEAMAGVMVRKAREILTPDGSGVLLDLYCGYGLFSHLLARGYRRVTGIDAEGPSIASARQNRRHAPAGTRLKFITGRISGRVIEGLRPANGRETVILDPPRQGMETGVAKAVAARGPAMVLHIFCAVDRIPEAIHEWRQNGYFPKKIIPLDMFPGTTGLEVMVLLTSHPDNRNRTNRNREPGECCLMNS